MDTRTETFPTSTSQNLRLAIWDLTAHVTIAPAEPGSTTARVDITGDPDWRDAVRVAYSPEANRLTVSDTSGTQVVGGGVVVSGGSVVINSGSVTGSGTTQVNTFRAGDASTVIHGTVGGRVIVNGVDITDTVNQTRTQAGPDRAITITVPVGTGTRIDDCRDVELDRVHGRLAVTIDGAGQVYASDVTGVSLDLTGEATVSVDQSMGPVSVTAVGQPNIRIDGDYGNVDLDLTGQASVTGTGTYGHVSGQVAGQCTVRLSGRAGGQDVRQIGQCTVRIQGAKRTTRRDDWTF